MEQDERSSQNRSHQNLEDQGNYLEEDLLDENDLLDIDSSPDILILDDFSDKHLQKL